MGIAKYRNQKIKYLLVILLSLFTTNVAFSASEERYENYEQYELHIESDLYDGYGEEEITFYDPFEKFNRKVFNFNLGFNRAIIEPIGKGYRFVTTNRIRNGVDNMLNNINSPVVLINSILQLDILNSAKTVGSFVVNSTIGLLGFFNPAQEMGIYNSDSDFGQTLGKWKIGAGPYLVVPVFGPTTFRDGTGFVVDRLVDPLDYNILQFGGKKPLMNSDFRWGRRIVYVLNLSNFVVETFTPMVESSFDPYVMVRNAYLQSRNYKINK